MKVLIVDGLNNFFRNFVVVPTMDSNGNNVGGLIGFIRSIKAVMRDVSPSRVIVAWDGEGGSRKRKDIYSGYKAGRKLRLNREYDFDKSINDEMSNMKSQYDKLRSYLGFLGITQVEVESIEADDVIAFICRHIMPNDKKVIMSTDKDMLQLIDVNTLVYSPTKKIYYGCDELMKEYGILPENFVYMKAMMGDKSDNIIGFKGFGPKTVIKLFPFLAEKASCVDEIIEYARLNEKKSSKYKVIADGRDEMLEKVRLMQLFNPIISPQSVSVIRNSLEKKVEYSNVAFRLALSRDGIQMADADIFSVFSHYNICRIKENG